MDAREELKRWIAMVVELSADEESKVIKQDIDLFLSVAGELSGKLADRNASLARQIRPRSATIPPASPHKALEQPESSSSTADITVSDNDTEGRSQESSGGSAVDHSGQDRRDTATLRQITYGQNDDERMFRQAAKRLAR